MRQTGLRIGGSLLLLTLLLLLVTSVTGWLLLRGSLPHLGGGRELLGLAAASVVERDQAGLVTILAADRDDAARSLGYIHAQERYFEMDLARRTASGQLAALLGARALEVDRRHRVHRFGARVRDWWPTLPAAQRSLLQAYASGVNAGIADMTVRPWPYLLLRQRPAPWQESDSLLVILAMFFDLQDAGNQRERQLDFAQRQLAPEAFAFIIRGGSTWDAPLSGPALPDPALPTPEQLDLRTLPSAHPPDPDDQAGPAPELPGSNSFVVAGHLTGHGGALVANDMHLGLRAPNIWFRTRLRYGGDEQAIDLDGLSLPGVPGIVVGSNGAVAWGFTNSYGDWLDLIRLETSPDQPGRYRTGSGWQAFATHEEVIEVARGDSETLTVTDTVWGPVIGEDDLGRPLALAWTAHRPGAVNLGLMAMYEASDIDDALALAADAGIPAQNLLVGDRHGRIAWTIAGRIPTRHPGHDPALPVDSGELEGDIWPGWLDGQQQPRLVDPISGRLWSANARMIGGQRLRLIGNGGYDLGARAAQIRQGLLDREAFDERALLAIQLDDRALLMERWWQLLRAVLADDPDGELAALHDVTAVWDGCACTDSVVYRVVREFRGQVHAAVLAGLALPLVAVDPEFKWPRLGQAEGVVWQLLQERPEHLLPPPHGSWPALLRAQAQGTLEKIGEDDVVLADRTWGEANQVTIRHPLSAALPALLARRLDMPVLALPGDSHMPRVQGTRFGASQRMVVAPGREEEAIMHMPGGQSGHPWSPYYGAGHLDWAEGRPSPLRPGTVRWRLYLHPATRD